MDFDIKKTRILINALKVKSLKIIKIDSEMNN